MGKSDTGMSEQRAEGERMVQQRRYQSEHILQQIEDSTGRNACTPTKLHEIVPVSISSELTVNSPNLSVYAAPKTAAARSQNRTLAAHEPQCQSA